MTADLIRYVLDQILAWIQRGCEHPDEMVAVDILEGTSSDVTIAYCRRCGAVRPEWKPVVHLPNLIWRRPDPNLWRGR